MKTQETGHETECFLYNVAWLRRHYSFSKAKMARLLNISVWSLNNIEKGILPRKIDVSVLFHIQDLFGISPKDLLTSRLEDAHCDLPERDKVL